MGGEAQRVNRTEKKSRQSGKSEIKRGRKREHEVE